jgi:D-alanyl-D-alanine carboxypeptidase
VVTVLLLPGLHASPVDAQGGFSPEVEEQLDEIAAYITGPPWYVPGGVVGVSVDADSYVTASGVAGYESSTPLTPDMHFRIGSITKTFTATVVLQLVQSCELSLDDTIDRWQPQQPGARDITVENLLNMTSGIPEFMTTTAFQDVAENDPLHEWQPQQLIDLVEDEPLLFPPGEGWFYSNTNYFILGLIAEEITGKPLETLVEERIIGPLGLDDTSFPTTPAMPAPGTTGLIMEFDSDWNLLASQDDPVLSPSALWAAGAMISTQADLHTWARALADGTLLSPEVQAARRQVAGTLITFSPPEGEPGPDLVVRYGLGLFEAGGMIGHNGDIPGYESIMVHDPDTDTTVVVLQNANMVVDEEGPGPTGVVALELTSFALPWALGVLGLESPYEAVPRPELPYCPPPIETAAGPPPATVTPVAIPIPAAARFTG